MSNNLEYLGDGVYAEYDGYQIKLLVNDPKQPTDTVYIEPDTLDSLNHYANKHFNKS